MVDTIQNTKLRLTAVVFGLCGVVLLGITQWVRDVENTTIAAGFGVGAVVILVGVLLRSERWFAIASALAPALIGVTVIVFSESLRTMALLIIAGAIVEVLLVPVYVRIGESGASLGKLISTNNDSSK